MCDSSDGTIYFATAYRTEMETRRNEVRELMTRDHQWT